MTIYIHYLLIFSKCNFIHIYIYIYIYICLDIVFILMRRDASNLYSKVNQTHYLTLSLSFTDMYGGGNSRRRLPFILA